VRYCLANLSVPPAKIWVGAGHLTVERLEWTQSPLYYSVLYYHHRNAVTLGGQTIAVDSGDVIVVAPGIHARHARVGEDCRFEFFTFDLLGRQSTEVAIPVHLPDRSHQYEDLKRASERISEVHQPAIAFVWNLLWSVARSTSMFREQEALYLAEEFVRRNLDRRFTMGEISEKCRTTHRNLLAAFRQQHGVSIQEYILQARIQEASRLLLTTSLPVKEVAAKVGYSDLQEFNKVMRTGTGASPRQFREVRT
jgi:AraC-like DNA-binding protein